MNLLHSECPHHYSLAAAAVLRSRISHPCFVVQAHSLSSASFLPDAANPGSASMLSGGAQQAQAVAGMPDFMGDEAGGASIRQQASSSNGRRDGQGRGTRPRGSLLTQGGPPTRGRGPVRTR